MLKLRFRSFQLRVTFALVISMLLVGTLSNFLVYKFSFDSQFGHIQERLKTIARASALIIDVEVLKQIPLNKEGEQLPQYKDILENLNRIKKATRSVRYIYILTKTEKEGTLQFIVDAGPFVKGKLKKGPSFEPGDRIDAVKFPEMLRAFQEPSADTNFEINDWGITLSGYAPIIDKQGNTVAILGVDVSAADIYKTQQEVNQRALLVLLLGVVVSLILGVFLSRRVTEPIQQLVAGTHYIAAGDLSFRVEVKGNDEITELARHFNKMASSIYRSRRRLHNYFYRVIQSMMMIIEARDPYTKGHAERVAVYAEKIAQKLGVSAENIELLKETAILHDIGKLGIQEDLLHKKEKLTEDEIELIHKHTLIGEDILRPILINPELLEIIRGHHERFDGQGYPDKRQGEKISLFTQIISVADAYDAMTSRRPYRKPLTKQEAIAEIERNKGKQFNPQVADTFIQILSEEKDR